MWRANWWPIAPNPMTPALMLLLMGCCLSSERVIAGPIMRDRITLQSPSRCDLHDARLHHRVDFRRLEAEFARQHITRVLSKLRREAMTVHRIVRHLQRI